MLLLLHVVNKSVILILLFYEVIGSQGSQNDNFHNKRHILVQLINLILINCFIIGSNYCMYDLMIMRSVLIIRRQLA